MSKKLKIELDSGQRVTSPMVHDCEIMEISIPNFELSKTVKINIRNEEQQRFELCLLDCRVANFKGFYKQNVISDVIIRDNLFLLANLDLYKIDFDLATNYHRAGIEEDIKNNHLILVEIIPSVGFSGLFLCRDLEITLIG